VSAYVGSSKNIKDLERSEGPCVVARIKRPTPGPARYFAPPPALLAKSLSWDLYKVEANRRRRLVASGRVTRRAKMGARLPPSKRVTTRLAGGIYASMKIGVSTLPTRSPCLRGGLLAMTLATPGRQPTTRRKNTAFRARTYHHLAKKLKPPGS
jgi:hypothetical protein